MTTIVNTILTCQITSAGSGYSLYETVPVFADGAQIGTAECGSAYCTGISIESPGAGLKDGNWPINGQNPAGYVTVVNGVVVSGTITSSGLFSGNVGAITANIEMDYVRWPSSTAGVHQEPVLKAIMTGPLTSFSRSSGVPISYATTPIITVAGNAVLTPIMGDYTYGETPTDPTDPTDPGVELPTSSTVLISAAQLAAIIGAPNHDVYIRESAPIDIDIDFPEEILINDRLNDPDSNAFGYGWRSWVNPTQADLDEDLRAPDNLWEPVYGEFVPVSILTTDYLKKIKEYQESKLVLNSNVIVEKFNSIWSDFKQLNDIFIERIFDGSESAKVFVVNTDEKTLVKDRISVYINGVLQPSSYYTVNKLNVTLNISDIVLGAKIVILYKKYQPSAIELSFNPEVKDDILTNTQFKFGYDYTEYELRDSNDMLSKSAYYFWVKNKNTAPKNRKMSVQQAKNLLTYGPSLYMTFHNIVNAEGHLPVRYDSVGVFGLNKFANRDDTYKLRFTRNFTLRDDPNELDLKNVHAEWKLLRPSQNVRVPSTLWDKMVDSAVGKDIVGNAVPFTYLSDYDNQHGTSNRFGLGVGQILAEKENVLESIKHTILNTTLTLNIGGTKVPDYIQNLKLSQLDKYFDTPENIRKTLDLIWREAKPKQINELFFAVVNDALANNFEFKDVFKTSRLSVYSIKTVGQILTGTNDE